MNKETYKRSPFFYVGDKYKLLKQIAPLSPEEIENYYEPFLGGGTVFLNVNARKYFLNDIDKNIIQLHYFLIKSSSKQNLFFQEVKKMINRYKLSYSVDGVLVPDNLKKKYHKTYYAEFNRNGYTLMKSEFNNQKIKKSINLYLLLIYGFNRMIRFNKKGKFNIPVGNVDFNKNVKNALLDYFTFVEGRKIYLSSEDFTNFTNISKISKKDFFYLDPPYLITFSEYNKIWNEEKEDQLLNFLDKLNDKGIRFALSNVTHYKGKKNNQLIKWLKKYRVHEIKSNYISYHNNKDKEIKEVLVTNY